MSQRRALFERSVRRAALRVLPATAAMALAVAVARASVVAEREVGPRRAQAAAEVHLGGAGRLIEDVAGAEHVHGLHVALVAVPCDVVALGAMVGVGAKGELFAGGRSADAGLGVRPAVAVRAVGNPTGW